MELVIGTGKATVRIALLTVTVVMQGDRDVVWTGQPPPSAD